MPLQIKLLRKVGKLAHMMEADLESVPSTRAISSR